VGGGGSFILVDKERLPMRKTNYSYEKRQREIAKKKKKEEKQQRKASPDKTQPGEGTSPGQ